MKKKDLFVILIIALVFAPFFIFEEVYAFYLSFNKQYALAAAFLKFALLATFGEALGLRIKEGVYNKAGFGLIPRAVIWGFLGLTIKLAFDVFSIGTPYFLEHMGVKGAETALKGDFTLIKLAVAFSVSACMNLIYAPVMMTLHKITDTHIINNGGKLSALGKRIPFADIFKSINWDVQWHFVFKKTIPFFWIPAHTVTFLLADDFRVLFAALLGIALGTILAVAGLKK